MARLPDDPPPETHKELFTPENRRNPELGYLKESRHRQTEKQTQCPQGKVT